MRRWFARVARPWPDTIATQIALAVVIALITVQLIGAGVYAALRPDVRASHHPGELVRRIGAIVTLVEATPAAERAPVIAALDDPFLGVSWQAEPPDFPAAPGMWPLERLRRRLAHELPGVRAVRIGLIGPLPVRPPTDVEPPRRRRDRSWPARVRIAVGLADGTWLVFAGNDPYDPRQAVARFLLHMGLIALAVTGLSWWAARRLTRPIKRFAAAAAHLGVDRAAEPLPEAGPRELRAAIRAVNQMQARLRRFVEDRTRMLAAIGHDLRTPLTRLRLRAELVADPALQRKMLDDLDAMQAMLAATLSFARDDAAAEPRSPVDLADLLQSIAEARHDQGHDVTYAGPPRLVCPCRPLALRRALENLVDNAVVYGERARMTLAAERGQATIGIDDDGPGIPDEAHEQVFAPFFRLEASRSRETGGTGLGLAVARSIIRGHGGDVQLANRTPDPGLRVIVTLPL